MLTQLQIDNIDRVFAVLDLDGNGKISWRDFEAVATGLVAEFGLAPDSEQTQELHTAYATVWDYVREAADFDQDGSVSTAEFREAHDKQLLSSGELLPKWQAAADAAFAIADRDGDGYIGQDEVASIYRGSGVTDEKVPAAAFAGMDTDNDGRIDKTEFSANVRGLFTATDESTKGAHMLDGA